MTEHSPGGSALFRALAGWRKEIVRGVLMFAVVVVVGFAGIYFFRAFADDWSDAGWGGDFAWGDDQAWHETFRYADRLKPGDKIWIRNFSGGVTVAAAPDESLLVIAEEARRGSSGASAGVVAVPHEGGITICAVWDGDPSRCSARGQYTVPAPRQGGAPVRFMVHVPRGLAVDASTVNGRITIGGVDAAAEVNTVNGRVDARVISAPFSARSVNGTISAHLSLPEGTRTGDVSLETVNGSITAALAPGTDGELEATTVHGRVDTRFPMVMSGAITSRRVVGRLGSGGRRFHLTAVNGSINLVELTSSDIHEPHAMPHPAEAPVPPAPKGRVRVTP